MFELRRVRAEDKEKILEICSSIWEGDDYIPLIFDRWVKDRKGEFTAVWYEGKIVGMGKLTYLNVHDVWLEGLRADPRARLHGIGKTITSYYLKKLKRRKNVHSIRFSTYFANVQSRKLSENAGFRVIHTMSNKHYNIWKRERERLIKKIAKRGIDRGDEVTLKELTDFLEKSDYLKGSKNFICLSWTAYPYSREMIREIFFDTGQYFVIKREGKIAGVVLYDLEISSRGYNTMSLLETKDNKIAKELFEHVKLQTAQKGFKTIEIKIPTGSRYMNMVTDLKMKSWEREDDFLIYEGEN